MLVRLAIFALLPLFAAVAFVVAYFVFYQGGYEAPPSVDVPFEQITTSPAPLRTTADSPAVPVGPGLLVVDAQHANSFRESELVSFTSRVTGRGFDVEFVGDFTPPLDPSQVQPRLLQLAESLREADTYMVVLPLIPFSETEIAIVERFVNRGGKLLLVSDPSRLHNTNSLAKNFGVAFQSDYLYNTLDNNEHFRRIFIRDFQPDQITSGLDTITLEYAGSLQSSGPSLALTSPGTKSSLLETLGSFSPMAWGENPSILAIADFTFMVPTNDSMLDNGRLVSNIADYVTDSEREFFLSDFPYFLERDQDDGVDILIGQPELLDLALQLKTGLSARRLSSQIAPFEDLSRHTVFLGLYADAPRVSQYLQVASVRVDDTLGTAFAPELQLEGTAITVLDQSRGRDMLIILADTPQTLAGAVGRLISGEFRGDLVGEFLALHKFQVMAQGQ